MPGLSNGTNKISFSLSSRSAPKNSALAHQNGTKRTHEPLAEGEESDDDAKTNGFTNEISAFGAGAGQKDRTPPRVIAPLANKDWRAQSSRKRQKNDIPQEANQEATNGEADTISTGMVKPGLQLSLRGTETRQSPRADVEEESEKPVEEQEKTTLTVEEQAIASLKGEASIVNDVRTIDPVAAGDEDAAFQRDYHDAPDEPSAADFESTPVDGFGAALLRGYMRQGQTLDKWREKQESKMLQSKKGKRGEGVESKREGRRPDLLGIGASEMNVSSKAKDGKEGFRRKQEQKDYAPLARKDEKTGEVLSEQELAARMESQKMLVNGNDRSESRKPGSRNHREPKRIENGERRTHDADARDRRKERDASYELRDHDRRREHDRSYDDGKSHGRHRHGRDRYEDHSDDDRERHRRRRDKYDERHDTGSSWRHRERSTERHRDRR